MIGRLWPRAQITTHQRFKGRFITERRTIVGGWENAEDGTEVLEVPPDEPLAAGPARRAIESNASA
jgi:hypothetical protein